MIDLTNKREELETLCKEFGLRRLRLFGSAATDEFDPQSSDIDFLVEFEEGVSLGPWLSRLRELGEALSRVLGYKVDVVTPAALRDPNFRALAERTLTTVYDAGEVAQVAG